LAHADTAGVVAFDRDALIADGAIDAERIKQFAVLRVATDGTLCDIIEKPGDALDVSSDAARWVGMNLWALTPALVDACARVPLSTRGELELPQAVRLALGEGTMVRVVHSAEPVLDLSHRHDIANVTARLRGVVVHT
jgi:glucose-1-phosphate thymidylyltransferase